ncbi:hypothetical protein ACIRPX_13640 [Streptomyces sp. NPDC101225]|uniref:hypothetical protein n=1 Tax=Streptomyces sp. NPDC101225 TaxID=3366135 RepID=UPI003823D65F
MSQSLAAAQFLAAWYPAKDAGADQILGIISWCVSACGVAGLIVVGMQMSLQLRRGEPGEGGEHFRGVFFVTLGLVVASAAGPIVTFLGDLTLLGP